MYMCICAFKRSLSHEPVLNSTQLAWSIDKSLLLLNDDTWFFLRAKAMQIYHPKYVLCEYWVHVCPSLFSTSPGSRCKWAPPSARTLGPPPAKASCWPWQTRSGTRRSGSRGGTPSHQRGWTWDRKKIVLNKKYILTENHKNIPGFHHYLLHLQ